MSSVKLMSLLVPFFSAYFVNYLFRFELKPQFLAPSLLVLSAAPPSLFTGVQPLNLFFNSAKSSF
jgi:hypothetical protein